MHSFIMLLILSLVALASAAPRSFAIDHPDLVLPSKTAHSSSVKASSTSTPAPTATALNCSQVQMEASSECWKQLNMEAWLEDWWERNQNLCDGKDFSICFQYNNDRQGQNCSQTNSHACDSPDAYRHPDIHVYYALQNIYAINVYFTTYYNALVNANSLMQNHLLHLVTLLDPKKPGNVALDNFFLILSAVLVFVKMPNAADISNIQKDVSSMITTAMCLTPTVSRFVFPYTGTVDSEIMEFANIGATLGDLVHAYLSNVNDALFEVNSNYTSFMTFAKTGLFSSPTLGLYDVTEKIQQSLYTFIISQLLVANNIYVATFPGSTCYDANGVSITPDKLGICGDYWADPKTNTSYSLTSQGEIGKSYTNIMHELLSNFTTGDLLFAGAAGCNGGNGGEPQLPALTPDNWTPGRINSLQCLSGAQVCPYNQDEFHPEFTNRNCREQNYFGTPGCRGDETGIIVPTGYAGFYDTTDVTYCHSP